MYPDYILDNNVNTITITLYNIQGGGYLGKIKTCTVEIFEIDTLIDIIQTNVVIGNITPVNNIYTIGNSLGLSIYSTSSNGSKRVGQNDIFLYNLSDYKTERAIYVSNNIYKANITDITYKNFLEVYTCIEGYILLKYYDSASFDIQPTFTRNTKAFDIEDYCNSY
jgi:hypothetical protein